jgi:hypothetical protein
MFNQRERAAILGYLEHKRDTDALTGLEKTRIDEAIGAYWAAARSTS